MKSTFRSRGLVIFVVSASLLTVHGCNVAVNPFEFTDAQLVCAGDSDPTCTSGGDDVHTDAGIFTCISSKDCTGNDVCQDHQCVPSTRDGGGDADVSDSGCADKLEFVPATIDFGIVTIGCNSINVLMYIHNTGCTRLFINSASILTSSASMEFTSNQGMPFPMEPGAESTFSLWYHPMNNSGIESGTLSIQTSNGSFEAPLQGTATLLNKVEDAFIQNTPPSTSFHLSRWPDSQTIIVKVDGVVVQADGKNGWTYDEASNNVIFGINVIPQSGAEITIAYDAKCL